MFKQFQSSLWIVSFALAALIASSASADERPANKQARSGPAFPLKTADGGRYLVDQKGAPFLIAGESPQAMMVKISEEDAELFFKNRRSHGFNTAWINLICAKYTGGRDDGGTKDGLKPFAGDFDFSQPNEKYFAHCDRIVQLAAKYGILVMLDPAETGSFLAVMRKNGVDKCRAYGRYLGKRYAKFDNILWFHGNDYADHSPENDKVVTAVALGVKDFDDRHLHTIELNPDETSLDDERWAPIVGISAAYTYKPVQVPILRDYNRKTDHRAPTFMVESSYEFEHLGGAQLGTPRQSAAPRVFIEPERCGGATVREQVHLALPRRLEGQARHAGGRPDETRPSPLRAARVVRFGPRPGRFGVDRRPRQTRLVRLRFGRPYARRQAGDGLPTGQADCHR